MITPNDIVTQLETYLPALTDRFSDTLTATASVSGSVITVTANAHGLTVGRPLIVRTNEFNNSIVAVDLRPTGVTRFTTQADHDLTAPRFAFDPRTLQLQGIASPWSGQQSISTIPNRRTFEIPTPAGETQAPIINNAVLVESRSFGLNGLQTVASVIDANTFTIEVPNSVPSLPDGPVGQVNITLGVRVRGAADANRADQMYTQTMGQKPYLFVIMGDTTASKDENTLNDSIASFTSQNLQKQTIIQNFSIVAYLPTAEDDTSGFVAQNLAYDTIYRELLSILYGVSLSSDRSAISYTAVSNGHGPSGVFNSSYYVHVFDWQLPTVITFDDGFSLTPDVAFRDLALTLRNNSDPEALLTVDINLDSEPIT